MHDPTQAFVSRACALVWVRDLAAFGGTLEAIGWVRDPGADTPFADAVFRLGGAALGLVEDAQVGPTDAGRRKVTLLVEVPDLAGVHAVLRTRLQGRDDAADGPAGTLGDIVEQGERRWFEATDPVGTEVRYVELASAQPFEPGTPAMADDVSPLEP